MVIVRLALPECVAVSGELANSGFPTEIQLGCKKCYGTKHRRIFSSQCLLLIWEWPRAPCLTGKPHLFWNIFKATPATFVLTLNRRHNFWAWPPCPRDFNVLQHRTHFHRVAECELCLVRCFEANPCLNTLPILLSFETAQFCSVPLCYPLPFDFISALTTSEMTPFNLNDKSLGR